MLTRHLVPNYAIMYVDHAVLRAEPWKAYCALLVMPGGADEAYGARLNGLGNEKIRKYVEQGGAYLGFCAGGYYGSSRCEFEVGNKDLEVIGDRELAFFPSICRGCAFKGFKYGSEAGARSVKLKTEASLTSHGNPEIFTSYYNGGGVFVDAPKFKDKGVEVLASYIEDIDVDPGEGAAAMVYCKVGKGAALLTGPHPEWVQKIFILTDLTNY